MRQRATITDVARAADVSTMTVSRVLNELPGAGLDTRARVLREAARLGYRPNALARGLKQRSSRTIALLVPDIANPFFPEIIQGAEECAQAEGYSTLLCNVGEDQAREATLLSMLEDKRVDGVIVCSARLPDAELRRLISRHEAAVLVNRSLGAAAAGSVMIDYAAGAEQAVAHLADDCGCRRIGIVAGPKDSRGGQARLQGARAALRRRGLGLHWMAHSVPTVEGGQLVAEHADAAFDALDGLLCYNDLNAIGVLRAFAAGARAGRTLPAMVGFDDILLAHLVSPSLTSLGVDKRALGHAAMRLLLDRRAGLAETDSLLLAPVLHMRDTTAPLRPRLPASRD